MKTHWKKLTNPNFLGAYSLEEGEESRILTIKTVVREMITNWNGKQEEATVAYFTEGKPMILNKTNCKAITKAYNTPYIEEWADLQIEIYATAVRARGEMVEALRVKPSAPLIKPKQLPELVEGSEAYNKVVAALEQGYTIEQIEKKYKLTEDIKCKLSK